MFSIGNAAGRREPRAGVAGTAGPGGAQLFRRRVPYIIPAVKRHATIATAAALLLLAAAGCADNVGLLIRPVAAQEELVETTVRSDEGLFISDKIVLVDVDDILRNYRPKGVLGFGENPVSFFCEKLDKAAHDSCVKAVVVRINSPGGDVTATDVMYERLRRFRREKDVPVIAVMEDVAASGGYYLACAADEMMAHPTSVTGSIGVIVQTISFHGTMQKLGIDAKAVTTGPRKALASPLKPLDEEDLAILQGIVNEYYEGFLRVVKSARPKLDEQRIRELADGRIYTGRQAKANGLVDDLGDVDAAVDLAKQRCGSERVKVVMYHRPWGYKATVHALADAPGPQVNLVNVNVPDVLDLARPRFMYLWTGRR